MKKRARRTSSKRELLLALGGKVRLARRERGFTQEDLATALDLSVAYVSLIERGGRNPPYTTVCEIAVALNVEHHLFYPEAA